MHGYYSATHILVAFHQLLGRRPLLLREEQNLLSPRPAWKRLLKQPASQGLLFSPLVRALHRLEQSRMVPSLRHAVKRLFHVPFCVDNDALFAQATQLDGRRESLRAELGIDKVGRSAHPLRRPNRRQETAARAAGGLSAGAILSTMLARPRRHGGMRSGRQTLRGPAQRP